MKWVSIFVKSLFMVGGALGALYALWSFFIFFYTKKKVEKKIAFECGFLPFSVSRIPFSIRFFFILMMFVVFDVEFSLLLQLPYQIQNNSFKSSIFFLFFFLFLTGCLLEEWRRGALYWHN